MPRNSTVSVFLMVAILAGVACHQVQTTVAGAPPAVTGGAATASLPDLLASPDHGVVCNRERAVCYDRFGPSIGLTEAFLGKVAADRLLDALRIERVDQRPGAVFSPAEHVECVRETGPCRTDEGVHEALTAMLFGAPTDRDGPSLRSWRWERLIELLRLRRTGSDGNSDGNTAPGS